METDQNDDSKLFELQNRFDKISKENRNLIKFNEDLREQIKILTGKLQLHQKLNQQQSPSLTPGSSSSECVCSHCGSNVIKSTKGWQSESNSKQIPIKDLVASAAQEVLTLQDYVYDEKSRTYYIKSTGWYYYQDRDLFYDPNSQNYYKYNRSTKSYEFYASLDKNKNDDRKRMKLSSNNEGQIERQTQPTDKDNEEGEVLSSDSEDESCLNQTESDNRTRKESKNEIELSAAPELYKQTSSMPTIRLIVESSDALQAGSLLLITYKGAQIGSDRDCDVQIEDDSVDILHARITYDQELQCYFVRDLCSSYGTYVDDCLLDQSRHSLKHKNVLRVGRNTFLVHIHEQDWTCDECEPGCVQAELLKKQSQSSSKQSACLLLSKKQKEDLRRKELKQMQKKYGLNPYANETNSNGNKNQEYQDRSENRRKTKGSDCPWEKTDLSATGTDKPIAENNKGFQLLKKAGWKGEQQDLHCNSGLIDVKLKDDRKGLGG